MGRVGAHKPPRTIPEASNIAQDKRKQIRANVISFLVVIKIPIKRSPLVPNEKELVSKILKKKALPGFKMKRR